MMYQAAMMSEVDTLTGTCGAVLAGQKACVGTGLVTVVQDVEADDARRARFRGMPSNSETEDARGRRRGPRSRTLRRLRPDITKETGGGHGRRAVHLEQFRTPATAAAAWDAVLQQPTTTVDAAPKWALRLTGTAIQTDVTGRCPFGTVGRPTDCPLPSGSGPASFRPSSPSDFDPPPQPPSHKRPRVSA